MFPITKELTSSTPVVIQVERGGKRLSSKEALPQPIDSSPGLWKVDIYDTLSLVTSLFRDASGKYQVQFIMLCICNIRTYIILYIMYTLYNIHIYICNIHIYIFNIYIINITYVFFQT